MTLNTQKEDFIYAYVYAVTAAAGYSLQAATRRLDVRMIMERIANGKQL